MAASILEQENARTLAGLLCIVGLLVFFGIEMIRGTPISAQMLWVLLGLIAALFGLDDIHTAIRGEPVEKPMVIYRPDGTERDPTDQGTDGEDWGDEA